MRALLWVSLVADISLGNTHSPSCIESSGYVLELGFAIRAHEYFLAWVFINRFLEQLPDLVELNFLSSDHVAAVF